MILNLKNKLSLKKKSDNKRSDYNKNKRKSTHLEYLSFESSLDKGALSCSFAAAGIQASVTESESSDVPHSTNSCRSSIHKQKAPPLTSHQSPFDSFRLNLKKTFKGSKGSSTTPNFTSEAPNKLIHYYSYTNSEPSKLTSSQYETSKTFSLDNSCIESSEDWSESISQPFRNSWQISPDLLSNTFSASSGHFNSPDISLNNPNNKFPNPSQLSLSKAKSGSLVNSNSNPSRVSTFYHHHPQQAGHNQSPTDVLSASRISYPAIQINNQHNSLNFPTSFNNQYDLGITKMNQSLNASFDETLRNVRSISPGQATKRSNGQCLTNRPLSQLIQSSEIKNHEKMNMSTSFVDDERLRLQCVYQHQKSKSPLLDSADPVTSFSGSNSKQSPNQNVVDNNQISPMTSLFQKSCSITSNGENGNHTTETNSYTSLRDSASSPPFIDSRQAQSMRNVAGTVIHEENEDGIEEVTSSTGHDMFANNLDPSLAEFVTQISNRTGTCEKDLVAGIAEVKRRPLETRNRLRRLGNISANQNGIHLNNNNIGSAMTSSQTSISPDSSSERINKRLSLPTNINLPAHLWYKADHLFEDPMSRRERRMSLNEIGFGKVESYRKLDMLGKGTYASVFRGQSLLTDTIVALKEINLEHEEGAPCTAIREVSLLRGLKHANVVILHDIIYTDRKFTLVFEYLEKDLKQYVEDCRGILHEDNVQLFLYQLLRGLEFCHKRQILHRDLKPQNLLINERGDLKLADFGLARAKSIPIKTYSNDVVTLWYRPPDVLLGCTEYSTHIDIWGVGCIFYEMATGWPLFPGSTVDEELKIIFKHLGSPNEKNWPGISSHPQLRKIQSFGNYLGSPNGLVHLAPRLNRKGHTLLMEFLQFIGKHRITATNALKHSYFTTSKLPCEKMAKLPEQSSIFEIPEIKLSPNPLCGPAYSVNQNRVMRSNHHHPQQQNFNPQKIPQPAMFYNNNNNNNTVISNDNKYNHGNKIIFNPANGINYKSTFNGNHNGQGKKTAGQILKQMPLNQFYMNNKGNNNVQSNRHSTHIIMNSDHSKQIINQSGNMHNQEIKHYPKESAPPIPPHYQQQNTLSSIGPKNPALLSSFHNAAQPQHYNNLVNSTNPLHAPYKYHRPLSNFLEGMPTSILDYSFSKNGNYQNDMSSKSIYLSNDDTTYSNNTALRTTIIQPR